MAQKEVEMDMYRKSRREGGVRWRMSGAGYTIGVLISWWWCGGDQKRTNGAGWRCVQSRGGGAKTANDGGGHGASLAALLIMS